VGGADAQTTPRSAHDMRGLGVENLIAYCPNDACRHQALIDVTRYPADIEVPYFRDKVVCGKCGGESAFVRPNWKERQPPRT
jgi:transposase